MIVKYGSYSHEIGQANVASFTQRIIFGPRRTPMYSVRELSLTGFVKGDTPSSINALIQSLENAYAPQGLDAGLYFDDGTPTRHVLKNAGSRSGVKVVALDYPQGNSAEFATQRNFSIRLQAEYDLATTAELVDYTEVVTVRGTGGGRFVVHEFCTGTPEIEQTQQQTSVSIIQQGNATGYSAYPAPNPPLAIPGTFLQSPSVVYSQKSPENTGNGFRNYSVQWSYEFIAVGAVSASPLAR